MLWVVVFLVLALAGLAVLVGYAVWLAHKTADLLGEVGVLADRAAGLGELLAQIGPPEPARPGTPRSGGRAVQATYDEGQTLDGGPSWRVQRRIGEEDS